MRGPPEVLAATAHLERGYVHCSDAQSIDFKPGHVARASRASRQRSTNHGSRVLESFASRPMTMTSDYQTHMLPAAPPPPEPFDVVQAALPSGTRSVGYACTTFSSPNRAARLQRSQLAVPLHHC